MAHLEVCHAFCRCVVLHLALETSNEKKEGIFGTAEVLGIGFIRNIRAFLRLLVDRIFDLNIRAMRLQDTYTTERKARQPSPDRPGGVNFGCKENVLFRYSIQ